MNFKILWVILTVGIFIKAASADENQVFQHRLSDWELGDSLFGKPVTTRSLKGKPVVIQYWGVGCSSCLKGLVRLKKLDEEYREKGLTIIGAEIYHSGKNQIAEVLKKQNVGYSITDGVTGPISVSGLPYAVVFAPDGRLVFHGHPNDEQFEAQIKAATADVKNLEKPAVRVAEDSIIPMRQWTDGTGRQMLASVEKIEGDKVHFQMKSGKIVSYQIKKLSEEDQKIIKKAVISRDKSR